MKIINREINSGVLAAELLLSKEEFDAARQAAYIEHTDRYPVTGIAPGLAILSDLEKLYGPAVLYDEALDRIIPESFRMFLQETGLRVVGKPKVEDLQFTPEGGVWYRIVSDLYPDVTLGEYKGIQVPYSRQYEQAEYEQAVLQRACENLQGEIPTHMIERQLDAMLAQQKMHINGDAVYHLLADVQVLLDQAYREAGVVRPMVQVRREAMDLMLQTASSEHQMDWQTFFREQTKVMAERYHDLPKDYDAILDRLLSERESAKAKQTPDERIEEVFKAYLGSLELSLEQWRNQHRLQAARDVCRDLLLDGIASKEGLNVSEADIHLFIQELADQYQRSPEELENNIDKEALRGKLLRDKALILVLNSASTDEEARDQLQEKRKAAREKLTKEAMIKKE